MHNVGRGELATMDMHAEVQHHQGTNRGWPCSCVSQARLNKCPHDFPTFFCGISAPNDRQDKLDLFSEPQLTFRILEIIIVNIFSDNIDDTIKDPPNWRIG
jgi:hypothetical protein